MKRGSINRKRHDTDDPAHLDTAVKPIGIYTLLAAPHVIPNVVRDLLNVAEDRLVRCRRGSLTTFGMTWGVQDDVGSSG